MISNFPSHIHRVGEYENSRPIFMGLRRKGDAIIVYGFIANQLVLKPADRIWFEGIEERNPLYYTFSCRIAFGSRNPQLFVVSNEIISDSRGRALIPILPSMKTKEMSEYFNVNQLPSKGQRMRILGKSGSQYKIGFNYEMDM